VAGVALLDGTTLSASGIRIGVSSCLLGESVRWDGGHKRDRFLTGVLGPFVEFVPVCPEVELGLGTPRETLRLERVEDELRLVTPKTGVDQTLPMRRWAERRVRELERLDLCGYVLKKDSPSCGMERVRVYGTRAGAPARNGRGLFAAALLERLPDLPVEEEGRLQDPKLRENFIERVFAARRLEDFFGQRWTVGSLVAFHTDQKLLLMAHSPKAYREIGQLVARARELSRSGLRRRYQAEYMAALRVPATTRRHTNALQHMLGHLRRRLGDADRHELAALVEDYRRGLVPLVVPLTLLRHHVRQQRLGYLEGQVYLEPHTRELMLRNHA
jgi:uncharacterized protein YbgA (DUF1722 family)/uncharacterized protein YbbK (DUF523 family)